MTFDCYYTFAGSNWEPISMKDIPTLEVVSESERKNAEELDLSNYQCDAIIKLSKKSSKQIFKVLLTSPEILGNICGNKRIIYLALHGKKIRTRKKNINRIYKEVLNGREKRRTEE